MMSDAAAQERLRRWRLILGGGEADGICSEVDGSTTLLSTDDQAIDGALSALYDADRKGSLGKSSPKLARWLGDIRSYFPSSVVRIIQKDAFERLDLERMLLEPEMLEAVEPDVNLVATLVSLRGVMPNKTKDTARLVIRTVVEELQRKLATPMRQAVMGTLNRSIRNRRPRFNEIDWNRTIRANLKHYQPDYQTIIPETRIGYGRKRSSLQDIVLCVDQSGSMMTSVVYSSIFSAVLASLPAVTTKLVTFDTSVVDLSEQLEDPVEVLFGIQLGGGTDINQALKYSQQLIERPHSTILVLITDLFEGGDRQALLKRLVRIVDSGVQLIVLLALDDQGSPSFNHSIAEFLAQIGVPAFGCTPAQFPDLMAAAIKRDDIGQWAANQGITLSSHSHELRFL